MHHSPVTPRLPCPSVSTAFLTRVLFAGSISRHLDRDYGTKLHEAFARPGGEALRQWIDACPNSLYSALVVKGGAAWREHVLDDIGARRGVRGLVSEYGDEELAALMTNLGGHDMESVLDAFCS